MRKHFSATVYIVSKINNQERVLLHRHKKHNVWLAIGGHVEKNENPIQAALREVKEETGVSVTLVNTKPKIVTSKSVSVLPSPFLILEQYIPEYEREPEHYHIDLIYFATLSNYLDVQMIEEYRWFSEAELKGVELSEVKDIGKQALKQCKLFL